MKPWDIIGWTIITVAVAAIGAMLVGWLVAYVTVLRRKLRPRERCDVWHPCDCWRSTSDGT